MVPSLYLEVSSLNQHPIVDVEVSGCFNMKCALFIVDTFGDVVDVVVHYTHLVEPFFCGRRGEFIVVIKVYGVLIPAKETSAGGEVVGSSSCTTIGKVYKR